MRATRNTTQALPALGAKGDVPIHIVPQPSRLPSAAIGYPGKSGSSLSKLIRQLRFRHLVLLVALDEHRNLHRAAKAVHLAQPTATGQVRDLELLFGAPLFDRLPTGMHPTELGAIILAFARRALGDLKRLSGALDSRQAGCDGHFVIGATSDLLPEVVTHAIAEMKRRRPMLAVKLRGDPSDALIDRLIEGHTDLVVGYFADNPPQEEISYEAIGREFLCVVARPHHPLSHDPPLKPSALEHAAWILHPHIPATCQAVDRICLRVGLSRPANILESSSLAMTLSLLSNSDAITILPEGAVRQPLRTGQLIHLPIAVGDCSLEFGILACRRVPPGRAALEFSELLRLRHDSSERIDEVEQSCLT